MSHILETRRLVIRELTAGDADAVAAMLTDPEVMRYWPRPYTRAEAAEWIERQRARYASHGYGYWLLVDKGSGEPVGQAGVLPQDTDAGEETGLGWIVHRPFWRQGYAAEAGAACRDYTFTVLGRPEVIALIRPENTPSRGVADKLGMKAGRVILYKEFDHIVYSIGRL